MWTALTLAHRLAVAVLCEQLYRAGEIDRGGALPDALTPVYPTVAGLPQAYLRRAVAAALARADLSETLPAAISDRNAGVPAWDLRHSLTFLHHPTPEVSIAELEAGSHPAWQRLKAEELLAQQLSQLQAKRERDRLRAPSLSAHPGGLHERLRAALPFGLTGAQRRVGEEIARDLARTVPMHRLLQGERRLVDHVGRRRPVDLGQAAGAGRVRHAVHARQQHEELVTTKPSNGGCHGRRLDRVLRHVVRGAQLLLEAPGDFRQHQVADRVAMGVVDGLEVVEIDHHQRERRAVEACRSQPVVEAAIELQLDSQGAAELTLELTYRTPCALWRPEHLCRLTQTADGGAQLQLTSAAVVWQRTGEDWTDVHCRFSTARPTQLATPPLLPSCTRA